MTQTDSPMAELTGTLKTADGRALELTLTTWEWRMLAWLQSEHEQNFADNILECLELEPETSGSQAARWCIELWCDQLGLETVESS